MVMSVPSNFQKSDHVLSSSLIGRRELEKFIIKHENLFKRHEMSWVREIIRSLNEVSEWIDGRCWVNTVTFLEKVKAKKRRTHKYQSSWFMKIFKALGASYRKKLLC